ncbi:MAG: FAD-dependent oxidoreductase [bacterium]
MITINEHSKNIPVIEEADICVLGGSCTGVFAAIKAARLGAKVIIIEKQNCFGGVATSGMVNIWHSLMDTESKQQVIAGLTYEIIERLKKRNAVLVKGKQVSAFFMNTEELKIELDEMVKEAGVKPYLHTLFTAPWVEDGDFKAVIVENKSGRSAIKAKVFIDATGDGDLCDRLGFSCYSPETKQPPTTGAKILGMNSDLYGMASVGDFNLEEALLKYKDEFKLPEGWGWSSIIPGVSEITFQSITRILNADCVDADSLTESEMEGRRQIRAIMDMIRKYGPKDENIVLLALSSYIGIRETRHIKGMYQLTEEDILRGKRFDDAIANGTYRVDIHHHDKPGVTFRYLDGTEIYLRSGYPKQEGQWREKISKDPTFYQIPYRSLVPEGSKNVIASGRMLDADKGAFGAARVMVNMNQTGEAAGVAAYIALNSDRVVGDIDAKLLRKTLKDNGSIIL